MGLFIKEYHTQLFNADFTFKTAPRWLMKLLLLSGKYYKTKIDDDWVIYRKKRKNKMKGIKVKEAS